MQAQKPELMEQEHRVDVKQRPGTQRCKSKELLKQVPAPQTVPTLPNPAILKGNLKKRHKRQCHKNSYPSGAAIISMYSRAPGERGLEVSCFWTAWIFPQHQLKEKVFQTGHLHCHPPKEDFFLNQCNFSERFDKDSSHFTPDQS